MVVHGVHRCASLIKGPCMRNDLGQVDLESVSKAGNPPMKQSKNSVLTCENYVGNVLASHYNAQGHVWASGFGALRTCTDIESACGRATVAN
jgi:hypothetical protein